MTKLSTIIQKWNRIGRGRKQITILIALAFLICGVRYAIRANDLATVRNWAGLAPFPASTIDMHVSRRDAVTWTSFAVRFTADSNEIDQFIANSPGINKHVEKFSPAHRFLPMNHGRERYPLADFPADRLETLGNEYNSEPWFDRTILQAGRRYEINYGPDFGEIIINDTNHMVTIYYVSS